MKNKMKQLFGIILSLVLVLGLMPWMSLTAYATSGKTVVYDLSVDGKTINKDGVTCTVGFDDTNNIVNGGTFTTSYGMFTKIVVNAQDVNNIGTNFNNFSSIEGWSPTNFGSTSATWTGNSSTVQFGTIGGNGNNVTITFTIEPPVDVTGVTLDPCVAQTINVGSVFIFTADVAPNNATDKYVTWSSNSDALKLYADSSCTVALGTTTGVAAGQPIYAKGISIGGATVTATSRSNNDVTASCDVTVISNTYNVTYKVVNGTWSDGSTADKTETVASGGNPTSVPVGMKADLGYTGGSWDTDPLTATISADTTFTYTFVADSSSGGDSSDSGNSGSSDSGSTSGGSSDSGSGSSSSGSSDNTNTTTDTSAKVPYNDVAISTGSVNDITGTAAATAESNPFGTKIENNSNLTTLLSLTDAEVAQGVNVWLDIQDMSATVSQTDKNKIENVSGDYKVGLYLDINLFKKVGANDATKITETNGKIKASILIPESLWKSGRTFEIIRVHDGVATAIAGTYDENTHVFTFETDKFSTYALAYKDPASSSNSGTTSDSGSSNSSNSTQSTAPKTGDPNDIRVWYLLLIASLGGLGLLGLSKKKEN